ncbi:MAG: hypothetical protein Q8S73_20275 [Deltaproteobacteria bacterium]|nr:hypothetical protein [Myxococcales bacterium]MDP3216456.1 hypothetical protein [Deltaproteobacteria bacterium]
MTSAVRARTALLVLATALAACASPRTELVIVVDTDLQVPTEVDRIEVTVGGPSGRSVTSVATLGPGASLPLTLGAVPGDGVALSPVTITAVALLQSRTIVDRVIRTGFVAGERRLVPIHLVRTCIGMRCPDGQVCAPEGCVPAEVPANRWPPFSGAISRLDAGAPPNAPDVGPASFDASDGGEAPVDGAAGDAPSTDAPSVTIDVAQGADAPVLDRPTAFDAGATDAPRDVPGGVDAVDVVDAGCDEAQVCPAALACCAGACVDLQRTIGSCGACGAACPSRPNAASRCAAGRCDFACGAGFGDCDGAADNGCETALDTEADCGGCGQSCRPTHAAGVCRAGACGIVRCEAGFGDCDTDASNGCEAALDTAAHCGACETACVAAAHSTVTCAPAGCVSACDVGWGDCNGAPSDGCETDLRTSATHCGVCRNACRTGDVCGAGICADVAVTQIAAGYGHACAVRRSGVVTCWGFNGAGALGDGTDAERGSPVLVTGVVDAVEVDAGPNLTCVRRRSGGVLCWGLGEFGSLGNGTNTPVQFAPVPVSGITDAESLSVGEAFACVRSASRGVLCWGFNADGQLGDGTTTNRNEPVAVAMPGGATLLGRPSAGTFGTACAKSASTIEVYCWGHNLGGAIGDGTTTNRSIPTRTTVFDAADVTSGGGTVCSRDRGNGVYCWGSNYTGAVGNGSSLDRFLTPQVALLGTSDAAQLSMGNGHVCVRRTTGAVVCWGSNNYGELGDGTTTWRRTPVSVLGLADAVEVTAGSSFTCARRATGAVVCWGQNSGGQLNDGTRTPRQRFVYSLGLP